ncbi:MAG: T9SS C-terminal target domain-containing protein, partial [Sphingobacteriia bacterium]|nr:T9SS C-terminal target domain-containing protein [Sphingobacteriia bacterium]
GKTTTANTDNKLWLYLVEDPISYATAPGSNGEKDFPSVLRKILPTSNGINCGNGSQSTTVNATYALSPTFVRDNLYLLAFVQANGTKDVNKGVKIKLGNAINTTSLQDLPANNTQWSAYPNPTSSEFFLQISEGFTNATGYTVTNAMGQIMAQGSLPQDGISNRIRISTQEWADGLYTVQLNQGDQPLTQPRKIMVRH